MVANEFPCLETSVSKEIECELQQCCRLIHLSKRGVEGDVNGAVSQSSHQNCICMCCIRMFKCTISRSPPQQHEEPRHLLMRRLEEWTNVIFQCNVLNVVLNVLVFSILHCPAIKSVMHVIPCYWKSIDRDGQ